MCPVGRPTISSAWVDNLGLENEEPASGLTNTGIVFLGALVAQSPHATMNFKIQPWLLSGHTACPFPLMLHCEGLIIRASQRPLPHGDRGQALSNWDLLS